LENCKFEIIIKLMKSLIAATLLAVYCRADQITNNDCVNLEGATFDGLCHNTNYKLCRSFSIDP